MKTYTLNPLWTGILIMLWTMPAHAQVRFEQPDTSPDYARYRHLDECVAAMRRLTKQIEGRSELYADTARLDRTEPLRPYPAEALAAGQVCMQKINVDTVALTHAYNVAAGLLMAGRDADVQRLYERLYATTGVEDRPRSMEKMMKVYMNARPMRLESMKALYERAQHEPSWDTAAGIIIELGVDVSNAAAICGDTAFASQVGLPILKRIEQMSPDDKNNPGVKLMQKSKISLVWDVFRLSLRLTESERLDSLAHGRAAILKYYKDLLFKQSGQFIAFSYDSDTLPVPTLTGDFMFQAVSDAQTASGQPSRATYKKVPQHQWGTVPVAGRVNLIAQVTMACYDAWYLTLPRKLMTEGHSVSQCARLAAVLRRMKQKFPTIEITLLAQTHGYFANSGILSPEQEADTLAQYFLGHYKIPARLLIERTDFFRITNPTMDQRRIDRLTPNADKLTFFKRKNLNDNLTLIAIDQQGVIFKVLTRFGDLAGNPPKEAELALEHEIQAVLSRSKSQEPALQVTLPTQHPPHQRAPATL